MHAKIQRILGELDAVDRLRQERADDIALRQRVLALKRYQSARFERTYADLLGDSPYRDAARFFLDELYGPHEFVQRDRQFARIVPSLVRMFPAVLAGAVESLVKLHALSEFLDTRMARLLEDGDLDAHVYRDVWCRCGQYDSRYEQIELTLNIGKTLVAYTRNVWLRRALVAMRAPAESVGLGDLQRFLERGFVIFGALPQADAFLQTIERRETALVTALCHCVPPSASRGVPARAASHLQSALRDLP